MQSARLESEQGFMQWTTLNHVQHVVRGNSSNRQVPAYGVRNLPRSLRFALLSAGCNNAAQIRGTPRGTYTVTITGTSGMTSNTVQTKLVVP